MLLKIIEGERIGLLLLAGSFISSEIESMIEASLAKKFVWKNAISISFDTQIGICFDIDGDVYISLDHCGYHNVGFVGNTVICIVDEEKKNINTNPLLCAKCINNAGKRRTTTGGLYDVSVIEYICLSCHYVWQVKKS